MAVQVLSLFCVCAEQPALALVVGAMCSKTSCSSFSMAGSQQTAAMASVVVDIMMLLVTLLVTKPCQRLGPASRVGLMAASCSTIALRRGLCAPPTALHTAIMHVGIAGLTAAHLAVVCHLELHHTDSIPSLVCPTPTPITLRFSSLWFVCDVCAGKPCTVIAMACCAVLCLLAPSTPSRRIRNQPRN
jgi:hypothetical protein